jgi:hypothetical protein
MSLTGASRGMSGPCDRTRARNVFGLSVGALIAVEAAQTLPAITRLAVYEPPLEFDGITQTAWRPRYERELAAGWLAAALVTKRSSSGQASPRTR